MSVIRKEVLIYSKKKTDVKLATGKLWQRVNDSLSSVSSCIFDEMPPMSCHLYDSKIKLKNKLLSFADAFFQI